MQLRTTAELLEWVFGEASEHTGCHPPWATDVEREAMRLFKRALEKAIARMPRTGKDELERRARALGTAMQLKVELGREKYDEDCLKARRQLDKYTP